MVDYIVCGWFTPDYAPFADKLRANLDRLGEPHDFVPAPKRNGGWEANTMAKAQHVLDAMDRHPGKTVIFLDVDCDVNATLAPLAQGRADLGFFVQEATRKNGRARALVRSGTLALKPTARLFVERWAELSCNPAYGDVDQDALTLALATPNVTFEHIDVRWCCTESDVCSNPVVMHHFASRGSAKISHTRRRLVRLAQAVGYH
jgi:hypothetical protein